MSVLKGFHCNHCQDHNNHDFHGSFKHNHYQQSKIPLLLCISQFHLCPGPPPGLLRGICTPCQSRGSGICKFSTARGPGICQPRGHSRGFDTHAVSYQNITTRKVLLEKKQIGSSIKDKNKLKRLVKACSRFYACVSSLLITPELHSEIGAIDVNQRFFGH